MPVLLDDTPLAAELAPLQGIDLRGAIRHGGSRFFRYISTLAVAASLLVALVITGTALSLRTAAHAVPPPSMPAPAGAGPSVLPGPGPVVAVTPVPPSLTLARTATAATAAALAVLAAATVYQRRQLVRRFREFL